MSFLRHNNYTDWFQKFFFIKKLLFELTTKSQFNFIFHVLYIPSLTEVGIYIQDTNFLWKIDEGPVLLKNGK